MGLESATFIQDLDAANPLSTDKKTQGDDHLRLIKSVLKATFLRATKAWAFPGGLARTANYTVLSTDQNLTIRCDTTSAAFTLTLPTLVAADAGWFIIVVKENAGTNPVFIQPGAGTINGFTKVRRTGLGQLSVVLWTGNSWVASRPNGAPIGTLLDYGATTAPLGHLLCAGGTFTAADFVELNTVLGGNSLPDCRGRVAAALDNLGGSAANRLTAASGMAGTTLFGTGSSGETMTLNQTHLPSSISAQSVTVNITDNRTWQAKGGNNLVAAGTNMAFHSSTHDDTEIDVDITSGGISASGSLPSLGGSSTPFSNVQPTIMVGKIIVAE